MSHAGMRVRYVRSLLRHIAPLIVTANTHFCIYNAVYVSAETDALNNLVICQQQRHISCSLYQQIINVLMIGNIHQSPLVHSALILNNKKLLLCCSLHP